MNMSTLDPETERAVERILGRPKGFWSDCDIDLATRVLRGEAQQALDEAEVLLRFKAWRATPEGKAYVARMKAGRERRQ